MLLSRGLGVVWRSARHDGRVPSAGYARQGLDAPKEMERNELEGIQVKDRGRGPWIGVKGGRRSKRGRDVSEVV